MRSGAPGNILWRHARRIKAIHILAVAVQLAVVEEEEGDRGLRPRSVRLRPVPEEPLEPGGARRRLVRQLRHQADARLEVRPTELLSYPAVQRGVAERDMRGRARVGQLVLGLPGELLVPELLEPRAPETWRARGRRSGGARKWHFGAREAATEGGSAARASSRGTRPTPPAMRGTQRSEARRFRVPQPRQRRRASPRPSAAGWKRSRYPPR